MANLHELISGFLGRKRPTAQTEIRVNPAEEMMTVVVDSTPDKSAPYVNLGDLGTFEHQADGTVVFRASDNPRVKAVQVGRKLPIGGVGSG